MNMRLFALLLVTFLGVHFASISVQAAEVFGIAATVNEDAISEADVNDRMQLIFASSGLANNKANRARVRPQAVESLIEEQLKIQEAARQNIEISKEEVLEGFNAIATSNQMTSDQFVQVMKQQGIPQATLLAQLKAQIAWNKVIQSVLRPKVDVSENDVNAKLDRIKANIGKVEYLAAQVFLPVSSSDQEAQTKQLADKLVEEVKTKRASFDVVAKQFSKASGAENGGYLGWVQEGQLPKELDLVLKSLSPGQISPPIRGLSGYYILTVVQKRSVSSETLPSQDDVLRSIGLERLDRLQQRHLADIRSAAFIDRR